MPTTSTGGLYIFFSTQNILEIDFTLIEHKLNREPLTDDAWGGRSIGAAEFIVPKDAADAT